MLLRILSSAGRRELRGMWFFIVLALVLVTASNLAVNQAAPRWAEGLESAATTLSVLAVMLLSAVVIFQVLMPPLGLAAPRIAQDLTLAAAVCAGAVYGLSRLGVEPGNLFTTSAIFTAVLAFAMQDTLGNVLGGVVLQLDNSLKVGDFVRIDDFSGIVVDVRCRYTAIETNDREVVVLPNSWLMRNRFRVLHPRDGEPLLWRRTLFFNIDPQASPPDVIAVLDKALVDSRIDKVSKTKIGSTVLIDVTAGYCHYAMRYWLTEPTADSGTDSLVRMHARAALIRAGVRLGAPLELSQEVDVNAEQQRLNAVEHARRVEALQGVALFATLSQQECEALAGKLVRAPFVRGSVLTKQGAVANWLYLIVRGQAEVVVDQNGQSTSVSILKAGDFFGEMGMLTGEPRRATVLAKTEVECYRLDKDGFSHVLLQRPDIAVDISQILELRQHALTDVLSHSAAGAGAARSGDVLGRIKGFFGIH